MKIEDIMQAATPFAVRKDFHPEDNLFLKLQEYASKKKSLPEVIQVENSAGDIVGALDRDRFRRIGSCFTPFLADRLLSAFQEACIAVDADGLIFYANEAYTRILGIPLRRIIGRNIREVEPDSILTGVLTTHETVYKEEQLIRSLQKYVTTHVTPVFSGKEFLGAFAIFRDRTEVVSLNRKVEQEHSINEDLNRQVTFQNELKREDIIGRSPAFQSVLKQALIVAETDAPVLIRGESGTGKEVIAKFIHANSARHNQIPITVNCAAIPPSLFESELFGYESGSFTGAKKGGSKGKFELADGSTLFLDEIGEMPITMQSKLLRVLQEGEIEKIGRQKTVPVDVRIIAATNEPLEEMIRDHRFRSDLYFRLNIVELTIPPLRERTEDILDLADFFLRRYNDRHHKDVKIPSDTMILFQQYPWPGNVRELQNCIEHGVIMSRNGQLTEDCLPVHMQDADTVKQAVYSTSEQSAISLTTKENISDLSGTLQEAVARCEQAMIRHALDQCGGSRSAAASRLGISRRTFYRKLEEYNMKPNRR